MSLGAKVGGGVDVVPLVMVPMHGMESGSLIRDLMDMDAWLLTLQGGGAYGPPQNQGEFLGGHYGRSTGRRALYRVSHTDASVRVQKSQKTSHGLRPFRRYCPRINPPRQ